jgi:putative endonuclease
MPGCSHTAYIHPSHSRRLYAGVTSDWVRRISEHRSGRCGGFTSRYCITRLVYFEATPNIRAAIQREKEIKGWS